MEWQTNNILYNNILLGIKYLLSSLAYCTTIVKAYKSKMIQSNKVIKQVIDNKFKGSKLSVSNGIFSDLMAGSFTLHSFAFVFLFPGTDHTCSYMIKCLLFLSGTLQKTKDLLTDTGLCSVQPLNKPNFYLLVS